MDIFIKVAKKPRIYISIGRVKSAEDDYSEAVSKILPYIREASAAAIENKPSEWTREDLQKYRRGVKLLLETAAAESNYGTHRDTYSGEEGLTPFQIDTEAFEDVTNPELHSKLGPKLSRYKSRTGLNLKNRDYDILHNEELNRDRIGAALSRLYYSNFGPQIPGSREERAKYWYRNYNKGHKEKGGKGTPQKYLNAPQVDINWKSDPFLKKYRSRSPVQPSQTSQSGQPQTYSIQKGDTLSQIGQKFGLPWKTIAEKNKIANPRTIQPGQKITIPTQ